MCHIPKIECDAEIEFYESSRRNIYGYADIYVGVNGYIEFFETGRNHKRLPKRAKQMWV